MLYAPGPYSLALGLAEIPYLIAQAIVMVREAQLAVVHDDVPAPHGAGCSGVAGWAEGCTGAASLPRGELQVLAAHHSPPPAVCAGQHNVLGRAVFAHWLEVSLGCLVKWATGSSSVGPDCLCQSTAAATVCQVCQKN